MNILIWASFIIFLLSYFGICFLRFEKLFLLGGKLKKK